MHEKYAIKLINEPLNRIFLKIYFGHKHLVTGPHSLHELATSLKYNIIIFIIIIINMAGTPKGP